MGTNIESWDDFIASIGAEGGSSGAYYTGVGGGEMLWLIVAIILCIVPLIIGSKHELDAYKKDFR